MFQPTAQKLIDIANENIVNSDDKVKSKFTIIIATSKRARQLVDAKDSRIVNGANALSIAVKELEEKQFRIVREDS